MANVSETTNSLATQIKTADELVALMNYNDKNYEEYQDDKRFTTIDNVLDVNRVWSDLIATAFDIPFKDGKYRVSCRQDGIVGYPDDIVRTFCGAAFNEYMEECASPNCYQYYYDRIWRPDEPQYTQYQFCAKHGNYQDDLLEEQQTPSEFTGVKRKYINYLPHPAIDGISESKQCWYVKVNSSNCYYAPRDWISDNEGWGRFTDKFAYTDSCCLVVDTDNEYERLVITILFNGVLYTRNTTRNGFIQAVSNASGNTVDQNLATIYNWYTQGGSGNLSVDNALYASLDKVNINGDIIHIWDNTNNVNMQYKMTGKIKSSYRVHIPGMQGILTAQFLDYDCAQSIINLGYESQISECLVFQESDSEFLGKTLKGTANSEVKKEYAQVRKILMLDLINNNRYADNALKIYAVGTSGNYRDVSANNMLVPEISMGKDWKDSSVNIYFPAAQSFSDKETASGPSQIPYTERVGVLYRKYYAWLNKVKQDDEAGRDYVSYTKIGVDNNYIINFSCYLKDQTKNGECFFEMDNMKLIYLKNSNVIYKLCDGTTSKAGVKLITPTQQIIIGLRYNYESWTTPNKFSVQYKDGIWGLKTTSVEHNTTTV